MRVFPTQKILLNNKFYQTDLQKPAGYSSYKKKLNNFKKNFENPNFCEKCRGKRKIQIQIAL